MFIRRAALLSAVATITLIPVHADQKINLDIDLGLWELTVHPQQNSDMSGMMDRLKNLPPEQQARIQAMMQQQLGTEHVFRECMTPEQRAKGFSTAEDSADCKTTITSNSATEFQMHKQCTTSTGQRTENAHFKLSGRRQVSGTIDMLTQSQSGRPMNIHMSFDSKWVGSDCGGVKFERVR
jgi:Protein of unknown function (DUF3617)